ncbi:MAG: hypothetical protein N4P90_00495 [Candidatus Lightella neohaematopini]|nr:hypothetical protein [Candidatus Lightella neohaematopini]
MLSENFSNGINIIVNSLFNNIIEQFNNITDVHIIETHHRNKQQIPSGTTLMLAKKIFNLISNNKNINSIKEINDIKLTSIRLGNVIGKHSIIFINDLECIEIKHKVYHRKSFAIGAIKAAKWIINYKNGLFSINDIFCNQK